MEPPTYFPLQPAAQPPPGYRPLLAALLPSPSVSVSVSSPRRLREAGLAERLNKRMVARPPSSCDGKWTFLGVWCWSGDEGEGEREVDGDEDRGEGI